LSNSQDVRVKRGGVEGVFQSQWKPFVGVAFNQRNFQSTSSQFAGASLKLGSEYRLQEVTNLIGYVRYISLSGPSQSEATLLDICLGVVFSF
jgi:hypothetical protein